MPPKMSKPKGPKPPPAGLARYPYKCPVHKQSWSSQPGLANHLRDVHTLALQRGVPCTNWLVIPSTIPNFNSVPFPGPAGGPPGGLPCTPFAAPGPPPTFRGIPNPVVPQIGLVKWQVPPWAEGLDGKKPKKDNKTKPKEKPEPVPVDPEQAESRNQLVPYLARGFRPQSTPAGEMMCALYALAASLRAVRNLNSVQPIEENLHYSAQDLIAIFRGPVYVAMVTIRLEEVRQDFRSKLPAGMTQAEIDASNADLEQYIGERRRTLEQVNFLDIEQVDLIMIIVNDHLGTNYNLGWIAQGYRGRWQLSYDVNAQRNAENAQRRADAAAANLPDPGLKQYPWREVDHMWNKDYINNTGTIVFWHHQTGPVVWIYSNNADNRRRAHYGEEGANSHWEGMTTGDNPNGRRIVEGLGLAEEIRNQGLVGVARVTRDTALDTGDPDNQPMVYRGHFVTPVDSPLAAQDYKAVRTGGEVAVVGLIPNTNLNPLL